MEVRLRDRNSWIIGADVNISSREREEIGVERERERKYELSKGGETVPYLTWQAPLPGDMGHGRILDMGGG